jgi:hypothetical protein
MTAFRISYQKREKKVCGYSKNAEKYCIADKLPEFTISNTVKFGFHEKFSS